MCLEKDIIDTDIICPGFNYFFLTMLPVGIKQRYDSLKDAQSMY